MKDTLSFIHGIFVFQLEDFNFNLKIPVAVYAALLLKFLNELSLCCQMENDSERVSLFKHTK